MRRGLLLALLWLPLASPASDTASWLSALETEHARERAEPAPARAGIERILQAARAASDALAEGTAHLHLAHIDLVQGDFQAALEAALRAREHLQAGHDDSRQMASTLATLAVIHELAGLYPEALDLHQQSIRRFRQLDDPARLSATLLNYGNLLDSVDDLAGAESAYRESLALKRAHDLRGVGPLLGNIGLLRLRAGEAEEAMALFDQALDELDPEANPQSAANILGNAASALMALGRFEEAGLRLDSSEALAAEHGYRPGQSNVAELRAELVLARAVPRNERNAAWQALALNRTALELAEGGDPTRTARLLRQRARIAELAGEPAQALAALRELEIIESAKRSEDSQRRFAVLSAQFAAERQRSEIALLRERATAQSAVLDQARLLRNSLIGGSVLLLALLLVLVGRIRQRRRGEAQLAERNQALAQALAEAEAQRGAAESAMRLNQELLRIAAEDLRVPLMQMLGNSERLMMRAGDTPGLRIEAAAIADAAQHLVQVVSNLVDTAELDKPSQLLMQPQDLARIARECCEVHALRAAEKRQDLQCQAEAPLPVVGDGLRLRQAIENLLSNAIKFSPPNRGIRLCARSEPGFAVIEVQDQGPGLRREDAARLFGRFQRLSARPTAGEKTTGLGLSLVKRIAELHGGSIAAESLEGGAGSRFSLRIPLAREPRGESPQRLADPA